MTCGVDFPAYDDPGYEEALEAVAEAAFTMLWALQHHAGCSRCSKGRKCAEFIERRDGALNEAMTWKEPA